MMKQIRCSLCGRADLTPDEKEKFIDDATNYGFLNAAKDALYSTTVISPWLAEERGLAIRLIEGLISHYEKELGIEA